MITQVLRLLAERDFYNVSEEVEVAKGRHYLPTNWAEAVPVIKRMLQIKTKENG